MYVFQVTSADITAYHTKKRSGFGGRKTKGTKKPAGKSFTMHDQRKRFLYSLRTLACQHLEESQTPSSQGQVFIFWHRILLPVFTCPVHAWTSICMCIYIYIYIYIYTICFELLLTPVLAMGVRLSMLLSLSYVPGTLLPLCPWNRTLMTSSPKNKCTGIKSWTSGASADTVCAKPRKRQLQLR
jgi:hypothetical protein